MAQRNVGNVETQRGRPVTAHDAAVANQMFEMFLGASTLKTILGSYRYICECIHLKPNVLPQFYPKLKANLTSWRAKALWKKFDLRANQKCYGKGKLCPNTRVLIIGAGPCGLRTAIEAQLLGAKVVVVEKRDRMSRNNVLHLWPFVIDDLRSLGAKKFFGKFCAGAIDHISIRQLQCILLKVALLLGVEVHTEVSFERLIEPNPTEKTGWRAECKPAEHPVSQFEFDVIIGADGKRNTLRGFKRKEFRGRLAIAITANFINKRTEAEARVEEISGVAFIFNQKFFKDLYEETGIDLENIVYYKDDTHYFVMTAKKPSLIDKRVIKQDLPDTARLLAPDNVDRDALMNYAREAAEFSTNYNMLDLEFALNHYGQPDVAMFDFTSMYAAENASRVLERHGYKLLTILVGDSLLEPFWPTGSGCARGFLSSLDAGWAIRSYGSGMLTPLEVLAERESIYRLLAQTTPENLNKDYKGYTLEPSTRYPNLNKNLVLPQQVLSLYDTDDPKSLEMQTAKTHVNNTQELSKKRRRRESHVDPDTLLVWIKEQVKEHEDLIVDDITTSFRDGRVLCAIISHYRPDLLDYATVDPEDAERNNQIAFDLLEKEIGIPPVMSGEDMVSDDGPDFLTMLSYLTQIYDVFRCEIPHIKHPKLELPEVLKRTELPFNKNHPAIKLQSSTTIPAVSTSVQHSRPSSRHKRHVGDPPPALMAKLSATPTDRKQKKRRTMEKMSLAHMERGDNKLPSQSKGEKDEDFQARIKGMEDKWMENLVADKKPKDLLRAIGKLDHTDWNIKEIEKKIIENKLGKNVNKDKERVPKWSREQFLARQNKMEKQHIERQDSTGGKFSEIDKNIKILDLRLKEGSVRDVNQQHKVAEITEKLQPKPEAEPKPIQQSGTKSGIVLLTQSTSETCHFCSKRVYLVERLSAEGKFFHRGCFRCQYCQTALRLGSYLYDRDGRYGFRFYCNQHFGMSGELKSTKIVRKPSQKFKEGSQSPEKKILSGVAGVDLLDRVETPERIEFANLSTAASSDHDESFSQMDEDEWTDRNFGPSTAEISDDDDSSSLSDTDSDDEDAYEEALEEPPTKEGILKWADRFNKRYSRKRNDTDSNGYSSTDSSSYHENSSGDDDSDTATEGEEEIRARELRKQEVRVEPPVVHTDTGTDTEIATDDSSTKSSSEIQNSATEISTDSEFAHDDPTPTRELPAIVFNDIFVTKTRGNYLAPKKVQIKSTEIQKPMTNKPQSKDIELKFKPLVQTPIRKPPTPLLKNEGYALNRTQSTGGIATKVSLELKKKYLLGESPTSNTIQKSGSASILDSKFKSFHSNISDCQKLLAANHSGGKLNEPTSPTFSTSIFKDTPKIPVTETIPPKVEVQPQQSVVNETEGRPRSPVHETSIIVPQIDWAAKKKQSSTSSESSSSESEPKILEKSPSVKAFNNPIPRLDIQDVDTKENLPPDSLNIGYTKFENASETKSIATPKKTLNQPKVLPNLENDTLLNSVHSILHAKPKSDEGTSGRSTPSNNEDPVTAVLTETELSDWARDEMGSDDFDYDLHADLEDTKPTKTPTKAVGENTEDTRHVCGKEKPPVTTECVNNILHPDLDNIEFMDTGTESSDEGLVEVKNNGYVQFHDEDDMAEDSLSPIINVPEATNPMLKATFDDDFDDLSSVSRNTGYCIIGGGNTETAEKNPFGGEVIDLKATDLEKIQAKRNVFETEEDSLLIIDAGGTTTEENTCSDSTVKNVTQVVPQTDKEKTPTEPHQADNNNMLNKKRLEDKLAQVKKDMKKLSEQRKAEQIEEQNMKNNVEFDQHCQRLQSKVDFGNAKDSIDIRKSRRQSKTGSPPKPDLIQEEKEVSTPVRTRKEQIEIERESNKNLIAEMVMNKMKAQNKSLERKKRNRNSFSPSLSPSRPYELSKSATTEINNKFVTPDVLLSTLNPLQKSETVGALTEFNKSPEPKPSPRTKFSPIKTNVRPLSVHATTFQTNQSANRNLDQTKNNTNQETFSLPDIHKASNEEFKTPVAPPRLRNDDTKKIVERLKQDARARAKLLSDADLGLSPEDKLEKLRQKVKNRGKENDIQESIESLVANTEKRNSLFYTNDTLKKKNSFRRSKSGEDHLNQKFEENRERTKSVSELARPTQLSIKTFKPKDKENSKCFKSDPNLLDTDGGKKKKPKDRERRKSITKLFTDLFTKKKDNMNVNNSGNNRGFLSRISPKSKDKSKEVIKEELVRTSSITEMWRTSSPPPVPPLPLNYTGIKSIDDSSDGDTEWKRADRSSCDTLDQSSKHDGSIGSLSRRSSRSARKAARQSQLKRHRLAQEIQRKLEETEVKTRDLEQRGVQVEKALRGESDDSSKEDVDLLKEWFDLMQDMTDLRRYERELIIRAQELELEDRHARLQQELKERLDNEGQKTQKDVETESSIIKEMLEIVAKRDSLTNLIEEDRQRYSVEDKGFEEQMLAKGINLTPLKVTEK